MNAPPTTEYEVRVAGHLDEHWSDALAGLVVRHDPDGTSTLVGPIADQAQLHGVLTGLQNIGATLLSLQTLDTAERLTLRPATQDDAEPTWQSRRLTTTLVIECEGTGIGDLTLRVEDASAQAVRESLHRSGAWLDSLGYALLAEEWSGIA